MSDKGFETIKIGEEFAADMAQWFAGQAKADMSLFLAHLDDGVVWGRVEDGRLIVAGDHLSEVHVALDAARLQQARLFGKAGEVLVWRDHRGWRARGVFEDNLGGLEALPDETYLLWGDRGVRSAADFTLLADGRQGLQHAPPIDSLPSGKRVALCVRHYVTYDEGGQAYIALSRLCGLTFQPVKEGAQ